MSVTVSVWKSDIIAFSNAFEIVEGFDAVPTAPLRLAGRGAELANLLNIFGFAARAALWSTGNLRRGDRHATVSYLRQQLARLPDLGFQDNGSDRFGTGLEQAVLRFQTREALMADGVVGPETWIRLFHRLGQPGPVLRG